MSSTTPNLALTLYDSTTDQTVPFATFRAVWGGPATTSNFYKIDTAYGTLSSQISSLQTTRGAIRVAASYISANYYEATGIAAITAYTTGLSIILSVDTTTSGTVTLNINGLGTKSVMKVNSSGAATNLTGSDLTKGRYYLFNYDGTRWLWVSANTADQINIVGTSGNVVTVGSDNTLLGTTTQAGLLADTTHAATSKGTPVDADEMGLSDSAATYGLKKVTFANLKTAIGSGLGAMIAALTSKTTPVDADLFAIADSAATNATKKLSFSDLKTGVGTGLGVLINAFTAKTTPVDADMIGIADSAASNTSKKVTWANIKTTLKAYFDSVYSPQDGWVNPSETWTRVSNVTFTVPGDKTATYKLGLKIKWTQTTVKYGTVLSSSYSSPNTTVTIAATTDYVLTSGAISDNYWSRASAPDGFPTSFAFTPSWTNLSVGNGTQTAYFTIGETGVTDFSIHLIFGSTTTISGSVSLNPPVSIKNTGNYVPLCACALVDWGASLYMGEVISSGGVFEVRVINASGTYAAWASISSTVPHTWTTSDIISMNGTYIIG